MQSKPRNPVSPRCLYRRNRVSLGNIKFAYLKLLSKTGFMEVSVIALGCCATAYLATAVVNGLRFRNSSARRSFPYGMLPLVDRFT